MFGGPPPPPTEAEMRQAEDTAKQTIMGALSTCVILYFSPFVVDYVKSLV